MQRRNRINGIPRDEACANIDSHGTANNSSPSRAIRPSSGEHPAGIIPPISLQRVARGEAISAALFPLVPGVTG